MDRTNALLRRNEIKKKKKHIVSDKQGKNKLKNNVVRMEKTIEYWKIDEKDAERQT